MPGKPAGSPSSSFPAVAHLLWRHDLLAPGIVHKGAGTSPARDSRGDVESEDSFETRVCRPALS